MDALTDDYEHASKITTIIKLGIAQTIIFSSDF